MSTTYIKFQQGELANLRENLLSDLSQEQFAVLFGKHEATGTVSTINIFETRFLRPEHYNSQSIAHLSLEKRHIAGLLSELTQRVDIDTIVDVHTHPFSEGHVAFSGVDDRDELDFSAFLSNRFPNLHYASIVLSQNEYSARVWTPGKRRAVQTPAIIKTQTSLESIPGSNSLVIERNNDHDLPDFLSRNILALGLDTMRLITGHQKVTIVGVGGLGSAIAENLIHMGFQHLCLIDDDHVEHTNLNRIVGATRKHAERGVAKVQAVCEHLLAINPEARVTPLRESIHSVAVEEDVASSDWLILCTDNHSSRYRTQDLSLKYFVPLISVGVNITAQSGTITDISGEVILARVGDRHCLNCLGRINQTKVAFDLTPSQEIKAVLLERGYVTGADVKEPAVKTLNATMAALTVDTLVNQFNGRQTNRPIVVFENNQFPCMYADEESLARRNHDCFFCHIGA